MLRWEQKFIFQSNFFEKILQQDIEDENNNKVRPKPKIQ